MYMIDTYALIEIIKGNKNFEAYLDTPFIINNHILSELCYYLIRTSGYDVAAYFTDKYSDYVADPNSEIITEAMNFRYKHKKKKLSMIDALSYVMALHLNATFLTGDEQFKGMKNVKFVK